jgi:hypothetical protein
MRISIKNIALNCFLLLMSFQILNLGIDAIDFQPLQNSASLGDFNYMNSLTEYVSEIMLGHKDVFPEFQKESPSSKSQCIKHYSIKLCELNAFAPLLTIPSNNTVYHTLINEKYTYRFIKEINPPPLIQG